MEIEYCGGPVHIPAHRFPALIGEVTRLAQRHEVEIPSWSVAQGALAEETTGRRDEQLAVFVAPEARRQRLDVLFQSLQWVVTFAGPNAGPNDMQDGKDSDVTFLEYDRDGDWPPCCDDLIDLIACHATDGRIERRTDDDFFSCVWLMDGVGAAEVYDTTSLYGNWREVVRALLRVVTQPTTPSAVEVACRRARRLLEANNRPDRQV